MEEKSEPRSLKEKQRQEREELILQVAEEVLLEKGYYNTSIDEIALRVGIGKGTLYLHFARKEDLIFALLQRELHKSLEIIDRVEQTQATAAEKLQTIIHMMYQDVLNKRFQFLYMIYNGVDIHQVISYNHERIHNALQPLMSRIADLLERGKAEGSFNATLPTVVMLNILFSLISPKGYKMLTIDEKITATELADYICLVYFRGIAADKKRDSV